MKLIVIGDTHGRNDWKKIVEQNKDVLKSVRGKFVFMGDYFDTHEDIKANEQMFNFNEIVDFKRKNPEKVELLIGNHDLQGLAFLPLCFLLSPIPYGGSTIAKSKNLSG